MKESDYNSGKITGVYKYKTKPQLITKTNTPLTPTKSNASSAVIRKTNNPLEKQIPIYSPKNNNSIMKISHQKEKNSESNLPFKTKKPLFINIKDNKIPILTQDLKKKKLNKTLSPVHLIKDDKSISLKTQNKYTNLAKSLVANSIKNPISVIEIDAGSRKEKKYPSPAPTKQNNDDKKMFESVRIVPNTSTNLYNL